MEQASHFRHTRHRKGQTLAEFALTLPLLLLLIFGIIEFGRLFQAWVTIQNAARSASRYASIGATNYELFIPDLTLPENRNQAGEPLPLDITVLNTIVPCKQNDLRGQKTTHISGAEIYTDGEESLFATWYDGTDCDPGNEDHQQYRKDLLRLISIMHEARMSSTSLMVEENRYERLTAANVRDLLYDTWQLPRPGNYDQRGYFDVMICSSRGFIDQVSKSAVEGYGTRFITVRNNRDSVDVGNVPRGQYPFPYCMLNEKPPERVRGVERTDILKNAGFRWLDPGDPGDRVTISVVFNHPLITPITNIQYIQMEARRSVVNESFRAPRAVGAFQRTLPPSSPDDPERPPTETPTETPTATETSTATATATETSTPTEEPFDCGKITANWAQSPFISNTFFMVINNDNRVPIEMTFSSVSWRALPAFNGMYLQSKALDNTVYWRGDPPPPAQRPQTGVNTRDNPTFFGNAYRLVGARSFTMWRGTFLNGPANLAASMNLSDFDAEFTFINPSGNELCNIVLNRPPRIEPTETPEPTAGPSPTNTPNCASRQDIRLRFGGFQTQGIVFLEIVNNTTRPTSLIGFRLIWPDPRHPDINVATGAYRLAAVTIGGDGPTDEFTVRVWEAADNTQDSVGNTRRDLPYDVATDSTRAAEGRWIQDAIINPGITRMYLDFEGPGLIGTMFDQFRHRPWHYDRTVLGIGCRTGGGGSGGGGGGTDGDIDMQIPSPTVTRTAAPTNTQGPTRTPSRTFTPGPPTATRTPAPATNTPTPITATFTPTRTPFGQATPPPSGGGE